MPKKKKTNQEASLTTKNKLIEVAIDLFSNKSFKGTSIRDIANEMGMTSSNIYHYFKTKDHLLDAIEYQTLEPIIKEFRRIVDLDMPPVERFTLLIRTHLEYLNTHRKESKIFSFSEMKLPRNKKFQQETFMIYRSEIERILEAYKNDGNSTIMTFCTAGTVIWFLKWYRPEGELTFDQVVDSVVKYILQGIIGVVPMKKKKKD